MSDPVVDHLVLGAPDLESGARWLERRLGATPAPGGSHPAWGTRNALLSLGSRTYLELLAPDPELAEPAGGRLFAVDRLRTPRLVGWAVRVNDIRRAREEAERRGVRLGEVAEGRRRTPGGRLLVWRLTDPRIRMASGLVPFLIDWGDSPHPADSAPAGGRLRSITARHPHPAHVRALLSALGVRMEVERGTTPGLQAEVETPSVDVVAL